MEFHAQFGRSFLSLSLRIGGIHAVSHSKYRNLVRRLLVLIRNNHLALDRVRTPEATLPEHLEDHEIAETVAGSAWGSLRVYDDRTDTYGTFTLDRDRPVHQAIADHTHSYKFDRIAERVHKEFRENP